MTHLRPAVRLLHRLSICFGLGLAAVLPASPALTQSPFDVVARVNDGVVTEFEVEQRVRLLTVLRSASANPDVALEVLIDDRLKLDAARDAGIEPSFDEIQLGIDDFAGRANLTGEEFLNALEEVGIFPETVRSYIGATLAWGQLVRTRFAGRARPADGEIDRALALGTGLGSARVLLSEVILPLTPELAALTEERAGAITEMTGFAEFEQAARSFSVAPTRLNGGRLDWLPLAELPPQIAPLLLTLNPGEVTPAVPIDGGVALFQLRAIQDVTPPLAGNVSLDYMRVRFPPGTDLRAESVTLREQADTCDDLYGVYFGFPEDRLIREAVQRSALPGALSGALTSLDPGEIAVLGPQGAADGGSLLMLCSRSELVEEEVTREQVTQQLFTRRLNSYADGYLAELRADAFIEIF